ncbi:hypothetical protein I3842_11G068200 [Carya illinoinensis]|uniref:Reverse transcriptase zinc-binding domain-containing protein n=1 Tax=Carya illinoinensis TaxID=32201 RepID=A0A922DMY3_CARIL|nr:hypothetical protein I3842_11G068200 [Carya illinoinensis]
MEHMVTIGQSHPLSEEEAHVPIWVELMEVDSKGTLAVKGFLESSLGSETISFQSPSWFLVPSFLAAKYVLEEGLLWRVGNGKHIRIWTDKWVPRPSSYMIQSPVSILDKEASVDQLINPQTMQWNLGLIHSIFSEEEANLICKMPISPCRSRDILSWRCSSNGKFSVKSAYHLQSSIRENGKGQPSNSNMVSKVWERLWSIGVPNGTKSFLWRAAKESLPTNLNLLKRKVVTSPLCPICLSEEETVSHALWSCKSAQDKMSSTAESFKELLESMLEKLPSEVLCEMAVTIKLLWYRRNNLVFEDIFSSPANLSKRIQAELSIIRLGGEQGAVKQPRQVLSPQSWTPPPLGMLKANWDAANDKINSRVGIGVVIKDSKGLTIATLWACIAMHPDPILGEAAAALRATSLCAELGLAHIVLEEAEERWSSVGLMARDIRLILSKFRSWSIRHVPRRCSWSSQARSVSSK